MEEFSRVAILVRSRLLTERVSVIVTDLTRLYTFFFLATIVQVVNPVLAESAHGWLIFGLQIILGMFPRNGRRKADLWVLIDKNTERKSPKSFKTLLYDSH